MSKAWWTAHELALQTLPGLPTGFEQAMDVALLDNPGLRAAGYALQSAEARVAQARAEYLPSARLTASYGGTGTLDDPDLADRTAFRAGASVSIPLFTGGLNRSRVAQALEQANAAQIGVRPCGSSVNGPRSCSRWRPSTRRFRSCSRPFASACRTCSTCRPWSI